MSEGWFTEGDHPPEPFRTVAYHFFWRDRRWFAAHPGVYEYVEGEFWFDGEDYLPPQVIERVGVALVDLFDEDPPGRGFIRLGDSIPADVSVSRSFGSEDAATGWCTTARPLSGGRTGPARRPCRRRQDVFVALARGSGSRTQ